MFSRRLFPGIGKCKCTLGPQSGSAEMQLLFCWILKIVSRGRSLYLLVCDLVSTLELQHKWISEKQILKYQTYRSFCSKGNLSQPVLAHISFWKHFSSLGTFTCRVSCCFIVHLDCFNSSCPHCGAHCLKDWRVALWHLMWWRWYQSA